LAHILESWCYNGYLQSSPCHSRGERNSNGFSRRREFYCCKNNWTLGDYFRGLGLRSAPRRSRTSGRAQQWRPCAIRRCPMVEPPWRTRWTINHNRSGLRNPKARRRKRHNSDHSRPNRDGRDHRPHGLVRRQANRLQPHQNTRTYAAYCRSQNTPKLDPEPHDFEHPHGRQLSRRVGCRGQDWRQVPHHGSRPSQNPLQKRRRRR